MPTAPSSAPRGSTTGTPKRSRRSRPPGWAPRSADCSNWPAHLRRSHVPKSDTGALAQGGQALRPTSRTITSRPCASVEGPKFVALRGDLRGCREALDPPPPTLPDHRHGYAEPLVVHSFDLLVQLPECLFDLPGHPFCLAPGFCSARSRTRSETSWRCRLLVGGATVAHAIPGTWRHFGLGGGVRIPPSPLQKSLEFPWVRGPGGLPRDQCGNLRPAPRAIWGRPPRRPSALPVAHASLARFLGVVAGERPWATRAQPARHRAR